MNNVSLSKKILAVLVVILLFQLGVAGYANFSGKQLHDATSNLSDWTKTITIASRISDEVNHARNSSADIVFGNEAKGAQGAQKFQELNDNVDKMFDEYQTLLGQIHYANDQGRQSAMQLFQEDKDAWEAYKATRIRAANALAAGDVVGAQTIMMSDGRTTFNAFVEAIQKDETDSMNRAQRQGQESDAVYAWVSRVTLTILFFALAVGGVIAILFYRDINGAIQAMLNILRKVSDGDLRVKLDESRGDEFGQMARDFNVTLNNVRTMTQKIQQVANRTSESSNALTATAEQ